MSGPSFKRSSLVRGTGHDMRGAANASNTSTSNATRNRQSQVLASLRATQIVQQHGADGNSKAALPAELLDMILEHLAVPDLMRCARASSTLQEMVYDDSKWVRRLQAMGCWDEVEARRRLRKVEEAKEMRGNEEGVAGHHAGRGTSIANAGIGERPHFDDNTLFDAGWEEESERLRNKHLESIERTRRLSISAGFDAVSLGRSSKDHGWASTYATPEVALKAIARTCSIRGSARREYGKVYAALAPYYFDLVDSSNPNASMLFRTFQTPEQQAQMLSQLTAFAKSDFAQGWRRREDRLDGMVKGFEHAVLREFEQGIASQDYDGRLKRYAHVLFTLNGGTAGVNLFVRDHPLILDKRKLGNPADCIRNAPIGGVFTSPSLEFFRSLGTALEEQANIVDRVFPPSTDALLLLVQRVTDEVISEYINAVLDESHATNVESYLKAFATLLEQSLQFADTVKPAAASKPGLQGSVRVMVVKCFEPHIDLYLHEELDFFKKSSNSEVDGWERRLRDKVAVNESHLMSGINRQAAKRDFLKSFKKVVMMPVNVVATVPNYFVATKTPSSGQTTTTALGASNGLGPSSRPSTPLPGEGRSSPAPSAMIAPTNELAAKAALMSTRLAGISSLFSIEIALTLIHNAKSSLERAALLLKVGGQHGDKAREQCEAVFVALLAILGTRHVRAGFDTAVTHLGAYDPRAVAQHDFTSGEGGGAGGRSGGVEPLVTFLELVNVGDLIMQMVDVFFMQELVAADMVDRDDFLSPAVKEKKRFEQMLDERVAAGLNKGIDVLIDEVEFLCATMQPPGAGAYNPSAATVAAGTAAGGRADAGKHGRSSSTASATVVDIGPTELARSIVALVGGHTSMLVGSTDKNVLDVFNQEVGVRLFEALCKHLKRQRISIDGAMTLISDTTHYYAYVVTLRNKALLPYFVALREVSQLFLVDARRYPKELASIIADADRYSGVFRAEDVLELAQRRADWFEVRGKVEKAMFGMGCALM